MEIISGIIPKALKVVVYGPEGIGKSTFASMAPNPLFIDTEGSTTRMNVRRLPRPTSYAMIFDEINYIKSAPDVCKTLVLDTADWAERMCRDNVCASNGKNGIEDFGYGKGYSYVYEAFGKILNLLDDVIERGINVILTAHAVMRKFEQPDEMGAYDRWELKLINSPKCSVSNMVKEWADMVLFANYETIVVKNEDKKNKAQGGRRVMYTTHHPCWDAKNRFGLPEKLPLDFGQVAGLFLQDIPQPMPEPAQHEDFPVIDNDDDLPFTFGNSAESTGIPIALADLMQNNAVSEEEIVRVVSERGYYPPDMKISEYPTDFVQSVLIGAWDQVFDFIQNMRVKERNNNGKQK